VIQGTDGNFYGTTIAGGLYRQGTIFKVTPSGTFATLYSFCCGDGYHPLAPLIQATDGKFYGTTSSGGTYNAGTVFRISSTGSFQILHSFDTTDGSGPSAGLLQATDGNFYGTAASGGGTTCPPGDGCGTAFLISVGLGPFVRALQPFGQAGATVLILGTNLTGTTSITFHGIPAKFTVLTATVVRATVPNGATSGKIHVVTPHGTLLSDVRFQVLSAP
jgi:uncharacterized repeat protein (TIGR03803 family)